MNFSDNFFKRIEKKTNVDKNTIIKRIQQVRRIMRYEENLSKKSKKTK